LSRGITDLITTPGLINLDFADVKSVMSGAGSALMGIGSSRGDDRSVAAAEMAISSPLLEASIDGAHGVLLSIQGGSDLGLFEINEAAQLVSNSAAPDANIIFGAVIDDALGDEVRVTVIAAGFDEGGNRRARRPGPPSSFAADPAPAAVPAADTYGPRPPRCPQDVWAARPSRSMSRSRSPCPSASAKKRQPERGFPRARGQRVSQAAGQRRRVRGGGRRTTGSATCPPPAGRYQSGRLWPGHAGVPPDTAAAARVFDAATTRRRLSGV